METAIIILLIINVIVAFVLGEVVARQRGQLKLIKGTQEIVEMHTKVLENLDVTTQSLGVMSEAQVKMGGLLSAQVGALEEKLNKKV